jgi:TetR/AcrR family transcriptional regulator, regulator of biofilm formation and stress response
MAQGAPDGEDVTPSVRTRILVATLQLVADEGVDAVTHRAVASRARVSPGSTTHHFESREHMLEEAFTYYLREGEAEIRTTLIEVGRDETDPIRRIKRQVAAIVEREFAEGLVRAEYELYLYACTLPTLRALVQAWQARIVSAFAESLEVAGFERPMAWARSLHNLVRGYELERLLDPGLDLAELDDRLAILLEHGPPRPSGPT